jgi:tetratricopeptide (TPR) repeat protein
MRLFPKAVLLAVAFTCIGAFDAVAQQRVALVVGNNRYAVSPLANPGRDARTVAAALQRLGFTLVGGGPLLDLGKAGMDRAVEAFSESARNADIALFYFAGHGMQVDGINYLVPVDMGSVSPETVAFHTLNADAALRVMESSGARLKILLLDACRTDPFLRARSQGGGLAQMQAPEGTVIGFATQPNAVVFDGPAGGNGPYARALETYLRVPGLDLFQLLNEVGLAVMNATNNDQRPWMQASPIWGKVYLNRPPIVGGTPAPAPSVASTGASLDYIQQAYKELNDRDYTAARATLTRAIGEDPDSVLPYSYRGFVWYLEGNRRADPAASLAAYREAFHDLDKAIELDPTYAPVRRHRGNTIVATYRARRLLNKPVNDILDRAIDDLKAAVKLDPTSKINANALGEAYLLKGRYDLAIAAFGDAIARDSTYAAPYSGMCVAYRMLGRQVDARRYARSAAERDGDLRSMPCLTRAL